MRINKRLLLMLTSFMSLFALAGVSGIPDDNELDEETRKVLKETVCPPDIPPQNWDRGVKIYKMQMVCNVDIKFFGRVLDQDRSPLAGVTVKGYMDAFDSAWLTSISKTKTAKSDMKELEWTAITDGNGNFTVEGFRGISLRIKSIEKDGYVSTERSEQFEFSERRFGKDHVHKPQQDKPVILQIWKKRPEGAVVNLIRKNIHINRRPDGSESCFDLREGTEVKGKDKPIDLDVKVSSPADFKVKQRKYDWSVELSVPDGGLVETEDLYPYIAPKDGYKPSILIELKSSDTQWSWSLNYKRFYVRSRNGQFHAIIDLTLYVYNDGRVLVEINSLSNANGSTDLMPEFPNIKLPSAK